jgi:hypothetical protein
MISSEATVAILDHSILDHSILDFGFWIRDGLLIIPAYRILIARRQSKI